MSNIIPSVLDITLYFKSVPNVSINITVKIILERRLIFISFLTVSLKSFSGCIRHIIPKIQHILKILVPTILPITNSALLSKDAVTESKSSGKLVPTHTKVSPIIISLILNILPILDPASTNMSDPFTSKTSPASIAIILSNISISFSIVYY